MKNVPLALLGLAVVAVAALAIIHQFVNERELQMLVARHEAELTVLGEQKRSLDTRFATSMKQLEERLASTDDDAERRSIGMELVSLKAEHEDKTKRLGLLLRKAEDELARVRRELGDG